MNDKLDAIQVIKDRLNLCDTVAVELEITMEIPVDVLVEFNSESDLLEYLSTITPTSMTVNGAEPI